MGFFGRITQLGKGLLKVKTTPDPEFTAALEKELEETATAEQKARAKARLENLKGGERAAPRETTDEEDAVTEEARPSLENPPKKTL
jgi:hypothetical protein